VERVQLLHAAAINALVPSQSGNNDYFLQTNGTSVLWAAAAAGLGLQVFTSSGTFTPTAGKTTFLVFCTGGGGGSGYADTVGSSAYNWCVLLQLAEAPEAQVLGFITQRKWDQAL
jgi:hypothetical protein